MLLHYGLIPNSGVSSTLRHAFFGTDSAFVLEEQKICASVLGFQFQSVLEKPLNEISYADVSEK